MPLHQYLPTTGTLATELLISGRVKVISIFVSNQNTTQAAVVAVSDADSVKLFDIVVSPVSSTLVNYAEPVDFENGLIFGATPTDGDLVSVKVAHSRSL